MEKQVLGVLQNFHSEGLFVTPDIPRKKAENAYASYGMPASVNVFAIVDATVFGSAKNGLAFTSEGLFWKNDWTTTSAKTHMPWEEFKSTAQLRAVKGSELLLGNGCAFGMAGSGMKPKVLLQLMEKLAQQMQERVEHVEPAAVAEVAQPVASLAPVEREEAPVSASPAVAVPPAPPAPEPRREPAFEGSYNQEQLQLVNAVAKRHRLSRQIQIAPAIKIYKVEKIIEISAGQIKPYDILMIADNTFLQTAKDFLVVTAEAIWAKGTLRKLEHFPISEIRSIRCHEKNLYINDYDFQFFDQFSENEVLIMTNMLKELVVALGNLAQTSAADDEPQLPRVLDDVLSAIYDDVIGDVVSRLQMENNPQGRQLVAALTDCCFGAFYAVEAHMGQRSPDRAELLGQYLLAQTLSTLLALRNSDELWSSLELQATYLMIQGRLIYRVYQQAERARIAMLPDHNWYLQVLRSVMEADSLDQGLEALQQVLGYLTPAKEQAVGCAFACAEDVQDLFYRVL